MGKIFATFCPILVKIGPLILMILQGVSVLFGTRRQKSTYHTKYLSMYWTELHQLFRICIDSCIQLIQVYLLTPMDRATLFNAKSTISHCTLS